MNTLNSAPPLAPSPVTSAAANDPFKTAPKAKKKGVPMKYILAGIVLAVLVVGAILGIYLSQTSQENRQQAAATSCTSVGQCLNGKTCIIIQGSNPHLSPDGRGCGAPAGSPNCYWADDNGQCVNGVKSQTLKGGTGCLGTRKVTCSTGNCTWVNTGSCVGPCGGHQGTQTQTSPNCGSTATVSCTTPSCPAPAQPPAGGSSGGSSGSCTSGQTRCVDASNYQNCVNGSWTNARVCAQDNPGTSCINNQCQVASKTLDCPLGTALNSTDKLCHCVANYPNNTVLPGASSDTVQATCGAAATCPNGTTLRGTDNTNQHCYCNTPDHPNSYVNPGAGSDVVTTTCGAANSCPTGTTYNSIDKQCYCISRPTNSVSPSATNDVVTATCGAASGTGSTGGTGAGGTGSNTGGGLQPNATMTGFSCSGTVCQITNAPSCSAMQCSGYFCPGGLQSGACKSNPFAISIAPGSTVDFKQYMNKGCGGYQFDCDAAGHAIGSGSCGAVTYNMTTSCNVPTSTPGTSTPPQSTPTPPPVGPVCLNITTNGTPTLNSNVTFTCGQVNGANHYEFKVFQPDGTTAAVNASATGSNTSTAFTISQSGHYSAECRICTGTDASTCQAYAQ